MKLPHFFLLYVIIACVAALAGCASVSVKNLDAGGTAFPPASKPDVIYVMPFDTGYGEFNVDRQGAELADFQQNLQQMLSAGLTAGISEKIAPSQATNSIPPRSNAWIVAGRFIRVNQGSRLLRSTVGFGAGGTKMETQVFVYNLADNASAPFLTFETTGGSGATPGMISAGPVGAAIGAVSGAAKGVTDDTARTARMITAALSDYMYQQGWISKDQRITPKMVE
ncbi:MAG TPA: DUF4410 domain-containing protein [Candidatus Methylacidiphilales bacterium]|nr:DUF4410 domain-containing protein [Candidatus Methylacidiphilales bacterium]